MAVKVTQEGFLQYDDVLFFKECVADYAGCELDPGGKVWGLEQNKLYKVYRPKSEVTRKDFVLSCNAKPLRNDHPKQGGIGNEPGLEAPNRGNCGGVLTNVKVVGNELHGQVDVWDKKMIDLIKQGKRELSLGYGCTFEKRMGVWQGQRYDFVQSGLTAGNHLALVDEARNGHDCRVVDCAFCCDSKFQLEQPTMDWKNISADELVKGLGECSDECKAKAKEYLNTPTADEVAAAEAKKKAEEEQAAKDAEAAKAKAEEEKKEAVDTAVEEQKKADEKECEDKCAAAAKDAVAEFKKAMSLADDCKAKFGTITMDGVMTEKDFAAKVCACDAAPAFLKSVKPEEAIVALRGYIAGSGMAKSAKVNDAAVKPSGKTLADFIK